MLTRRGIVGGSASLVLTGCPAASGQEALQPSGFPAIEARIGGRVGVCAVDTGSGPLLGYRQQERFAMASTFKWLLAAAALQRIERGDWALAHSLPFSRADILPNSPVTEKAIVQETGNGRLPVVTLAEAIVTVSDNCAANLLLDEMGGPESFTVFVRRAGDLQTRLDRRETDLNRNDPNDPRDTTTPEAMALTAQSIFTTDDVLKNTSRGILTNWLRKASTGRDRLRAGLPASWRAGNKTGTGGNGAHNDVAIAFPPSRAPIVIASYVSESAALNMDKAAAHAEIARIVVGEFGL